MAAAVIEETSSTSSSLLPYDRRDYNSILSYLEDRAQVLSNGKWTDFSNGDIGTVILKLISYLADMNNYQIDKAVSELYLDTITERESILSLIKLVGYEPRWYKSSNVEVDLSLTPGNSIEDGTIIPRYTRWSDSTKEVIYCNIEPIEWYYNQAWFYAYEGDYKIEYFTSTLIDENSRIYLSLNAIDKDTVTVTVAGDIINQVDNVLLDTSETLAYSVHTDAQDKVYIQLPSYWNDIIGNSQVKVEYLETNGANGNIGSNILSRPYTTLGLSVTDDAVVVTNNIASSGGYDPEDIEEIQKSAPLYASTMNTFVTLDDLQLAKYQVDGIADIVALDYNNEESGLSAPADAYKVNLYVLPKSLNTIVNENGTFTNYVGKELKAYIDKRRLTSIMIQYKNVEVITPNIEVTAYINKYDLRASSLSNAIKNIILSKYNRNTMSIGQGIYSSTLSKQILDVITYCNYIEINLPTDSYIPTKLQFLDVLDYNITVHVVEE